MGYNIRVDFDVKKRIYSYSIQDNSFFANMFLKLIENKLQWNEFCEIGASLITIKERLEVQKAVKGAAIYLGVY